MLANFFDVTHPPMVGQSGPLMLDSSLAPVWFAPVPTNLVASNLEAQTYDGRPVLTWWQGDVSATGAINRGQDVVVDDHYRRVATLKGADGWVLTLHSMVIQGHDAWVTANKNVRADLSGDGGVSNGVFTDSAVQEYDLRTGKLLYTWTASGHIPRRDSYTQPPPNGFPWDAYHVNSVQPYGNGTFLVSMRNTWAVYLVSARSGRILWTLGGKDSSFTIPSQGEFKWQHDAELHAGSTVTLFDDHCCDITGADTYLPATGPSRGLTLKLDQAGHTATRGAPVLPRRHLPLRVHGQHPDPAQRQRRGRLGRGPVRVGVLGLRQADLRRGVPVAGHELPRLCPALGGQAAVPAERRRARPWRPDHRVRQLERSDAGQRLEGARGHGRRRRRSLWPPTRAAGLRRRYRSRAARGASRCRPLTQRAVSWGPRETFGVTG